VWTGFFDKSGSPALKIKIKGPFGDGVEFDAVLDTGFTGFICMPLLRALPLGLLLYGTTQVELADGNKSMKITAKGMAKIGDEEKVGVVILEPTSNDVLLGMAFLRLFEKALFVTQKLVFLIDESRTPEMDETQKPTPDTSNTELPGTAV
jgi:predicted aspartyl protease